MISQIRRRASEGRLFSRGSREQETAALFEGGNWGRGRVDIIYEYGDPAAPTPQSHSLHARLCICRTAFGEREMAFWPRTRQWRSPSTEGASCHLLGGNSRDRWREGGYASDFLRSEEVSCYSSTGLIQHIIGPRRIGASHARTQPLERGKSAS